jgi:hypothetical protein
MPASRAQRTKTAERRSQAVQLRIAGASWETIAKTCGYASRGAASTDVTRAMEAATAEATRNADVLRHLEITRLDRLQQAVWAEAIKGDDDKIRTVLGIIDRRCKLLGLSAPQRLEVVSLGAIEAEIARLEEEQAGLGALDPADLVEPAGVDLPDIPAAP